MKTIEMSWYWPQENSRSLPVRCSKAIIRSKDEVEVMGKDRMLLLLVVEPTGAAGWAYICNFNILTMPERGQRFKSERESLHAPICA